MESGICEKCMIYACAQIADCRQIAWIAVPGKSLAFKKQAVPRREEMGIKSDILIIGKRYCWSPQN